MAEIESMVVVGNLVGDALKKCCGRCYTEIVEVKILKLENKKHTKVYGKIDMAYVRGYWYLFNRDEADAEIVDGPITLNYPTFAIDAIDDFLVFFKIDGDLKELKGKRAGNDDVMTDWYDRPYNELTTQILEREKCSLVLSYIVFSSAVITDLEIKLLKWNGEGNNAQIYGKISALRVNKGIGSSSLKSTIFTPFDIDLDIKLELRAIGVDMPLAEGTVRFVPEFFYGDYVGTISHSFGVIQVKATFWRRYKHPGSHEDYIRCNEAEKNNEFCVGRSVQYIPE